MSRDYKNFSKGNFYHVYNRGNHYQDIFLDNQDYDNFLKRLKILIQKEINYSKHRKGSISLTPPPEGSFEVLSYCLLHNHFHMILRQNGEFSIGELIAKLCASYVKYFNRKYSKVGNLFQDTFKAKMIETDSYLMILSSYIHNNPADAFNYKYSSLSEYVNENSINNFCNTSAILSMFGNARESYKQFVLSTPRLKDVLAQGKDNLSPSKQKRPFV